MNIETNFNIKPILNATNKLMEKIPNALDNGSFEAFRNEYSEKLARRI